MVYIYEEPLCLTRARGSSGKRSQPLKELLAKKYLVCVCVACATTCCWDKGNYCQLHLDTSNGMLGRGMASHIACYGGTKKIRGLNLTRSTWQIDRQ